MMQSTATASAETQSFYVSDTKMLVTVRIGGQLFGIPVEHVQDVLRAQNVARIPLAPEEVAGAINLRGRIVTVIDGRKRLRLPPSETEKSPMFVVIEYQGELYSMVVDSVGEVMNIPTAQFESVPANLQGNWREVADGICRLQRELLVIIDIKTLFSL